jgi:hypothetical protein
MVRWSNFTGPCQGASINPYSLHASLAGAHDIRVRFVAYKQYFGGFQCQRGSQRAVGTNVRLGASKCRSMQPHLKMVREADRHEIRVAVAERCQAIT